MQKAERCVARLASEIDQPVFGKIFKQATSDLKAISRMFAEPSRTAGQKDRER